MPSFGSESKKQLATADKRLQQLFNEVVKHWDCKVTEGKRSEEQQKYYLAQGLSKTLKSKHVYPLGKPSLAVDVAAYPINYADFKRQLAFAGFVLGVASQMGLRVRWGGDWNQNTQLSDQTFNDLVHFEIQD